MPSYLDTLKRVMNNDYKDATAQERAEAVREIIQLCAAAASAVTIQPIPLVDLALISPIQIAMVQAIGRIHGHALEPKAALEMLSAFGASLLTQNLILAAARLVPFLGWVVGISMAYALTYAIGEVSDHYFRHGRGVPAQDLKALFEKTYKSKKAQKEQEHSKNSSLKDRLAQLNEARKAGLLTEEEFQIKKEALLKDF
jgi:uncharacterized protein (DUF697 family)